MRIKTMNQCPHIWYSPILPDKNFITAVRVCECACIEPAYKTHNLNIGSMQTEP